MAGMPSRLVIGALFTYGIGLGLFAIAFSAGGHGIFAPLCVDVSPLGILLVAICDSSSPQTHTVVGVALVLVGSIQWGVLGLVLRWCGLKRIYSAGFLLLHYAVAAYLMAGPYVDEADRLAEAKRFAMGYLIFGIVWYVAGQVLLWTIVARRTESRLRSS